MEAVSYFRNTSIVIKCPPPKFGFLFGKKFYQFRYDVLWEITALVSQKKISLDLAII